MSTATLISVEEYLNTGFADGDFEYVDGILVDPNMGDIDHSDWQTGIALYLRIHYPQYWTGTAPRVQVGPRRFRVPDICLVAGPKPAGKAVTAPPHLVVEIVSPDDRIDYMDDKISDYLESGVNYVWVLNPRTQHHYIHTAEGIHEVKDGVLRTHDPEIEVPLAEALRPAR